MRGDGGGHADAGRLRRRSSGGRKMSLADRALILGARGLFRAAGGGCPVDRTVVTGDRWLVRIAPDHESSFSAPFSRALTEAEAM
jgi:hypothetical protein